MGTRISDLPAATSVTAADVLPIVQGGNTKKATTQLVVTSLLPAGSVSTQGIVQIGTSAGTVCDGADARLSNSRTPSGAAGGDLTGSYPSPTLATTGVNALTYGTASAIPVITVDAKGRITSASALNVSITSAQISGINVTQVSSLGANVATFLQTPTSANLISAVTDETGTGSIVFSTSPTITTPTINGYSEGVTTGTVGSTYTLSIAASTVFVLTLTSGTASVITMPTASASKSFVVYIKQPSSGSLGSATFTGVNWVNATPPTVTQTLGKMDAFSFFSDGVKWFGNYVQNFTY